MFSGSNVSRYWKLTLRDGNGLGGVGWGVHRKDGSRVCNQGKHYPLGLRAERSQ